MKKKEEILWLRILIYGCALIMFITALITQEFNLSIFGFILLVGCWAITFLGNRKTTYYLKEVDASEVAKPKLTINQSWEKFWEKFTTWLNN